ncbi:MAG TPA: TonB-dependent receptor [Mucilaginibacter sp.]
MKKLYILLTLLLSIISLQLTAQNFSVSGTIKSTSGQGVANATVSLKNTSYNTTCDSAGNYKLKDIPQGSYIFIATAVGYKPVSKNLKITGNLALNVVMEETVHQLNDVNVKAGKEETSGITRLKAVEGTTINAGKKSEVIVMDDINANKATNNTRQIYSKVAGLNIWESDVAGLQLGIGGRGLNPNRVTNFNMRQNGYDISADALGYPESYYSPPAEMTDRIEILRGASSLQYGTQFGGLLNFKLKDGPAYTPFELIVNETVGSWNFWNTSASVGGTDKKVQYYAFFQHKQGDGWRLNSQFNANTAYTSVTYRPINQFSITFQYTHADYIAHQPGGLTDAEFAEDPGQSIRARNWFKINWNLGAILLDYQINEHLKFNSRFFGLIAGRYAIGDLDLINRIDVGADRDLYKDKYTNYGNESRLLYTYRINGQQQNLLVGLRYYRGHTNREQGLGNNGSTGEPEDFNYGTSQTDLNAYSKYTFPNYNVALFAENIFRITRKFSIIPGARFENIVTKADGFYSIVNTDQAGNVIYNQPVHDTRNNTRNFVIGGIGLSYYQNEAVQFYGNISQNYRAINFNDLYSIAKATQVDPNLKDETGYSADVGMRGNLSGILNYDVSLFAIHYNNRIGTYEASDASFNTFRYRTNIASSKNIGLESFAELNIFHFIDPKNKVTKLSVFSNLALINARYVSSKNPAFNNKKVELAPDVVFKTGLAYSYKKFSASYQLAYTSSQFTDATNAVLTADAVDGLVPAYTVMDLSANYRFSKTFTLQGTINNLANEVYFSRRADSYPGPGIIPADPRGYYLTLQIKL